MAIIHWQDLDGRKLPDGDRIEMALSSPSYGPDDPRRFSVRVRLELGAGINWWKQVELTDFDYNRMAHVEAHDGDRSAECVAQIWPPANGARRLLLAKAKMFGVHTGVYELTDLAFLKGKALTLRWVED